MSAPRRMGEVPEVWETSPSFVRGPLVSALVFVYEAERFMRGLLEDLAAQTLADRLEIVVVDTGSPTDERDIVREFMQRSNNIAYLRTEERETTSAACNRAIGRARGKYLTIANADDRHRPDFLARMAAELDAHPECILAYADSAVTRVENEPFGSDHLIGHFRWPEFDPRGLFRCCFVGPQPFYRRELHERYGLYEPRFVTAADYELWLRVVVQGERFLHVPEVLGLYLMSPTGNENANRGLSAAESEKARLVHWPAGWGERPEPGGSFFFPLTASDAARPAAVVEAAAEPTTCEPSAAESLARASALLNRATAKQSRRVSDDLAARVGALGGSSRSPDEEEAAVEMEAARPADAAQSAGAAQRAKAQIAPSSSMQPAPRKRQEDASASPLVSIVIPTRDRPEWLKRAVESVLRQTYEPIEIVVVNDGGADVGAFLAQLDRRSQIVSIRLPESRDRSAARNAGLALARGTYVGYLDDDDWYDADHVATLVGKLEETQGAVAYSFARRVTEHCQGDTYVPMRIEEPFQRPFDPAVLLITNYIPILCLMHRRDCLAQVGAFDESLGTHEDWDLFIRLSRLYPFHQVERVTCAYSWRRDGTSTSSRRGDDFKRTLKLIHDRTTADAAKIPGLAAARERYLRDYAPELARGPACSVILPLSDGAAATHACLLALAQTGNDVPFELIVVDDGTTDGTAELLTQVGGDVAVLRNAEPIGYTRACNQAAATAKGRFLVFLSQDASPQPGWLDPLVAEAEAHPEVGAIGVKQLDGAGRIRQVGIAVTREGKLAPLYGGCAADLPAASRRRELQIVSGVGMLVRRETFAALGGFDEQLPTALAAADLCLRIREGGAKVAVQPASAIVVRGVAAAAPGSLAAELPAHWRARVVCDCDAILLADGLCLRSEERDGIASSKVVSLDDAQERTRWQRLVELQQQIAAQGVAAARSALEKAHAFPNDRAVLAWLAGLCDEINAPEWAEAHWTRLLEGAEHAGARRALARAALERGDADAAQEHLDALANRWPTDPEGAIVRGVLELQRERHAAARDAFALALEAGAERRKALLGLGIAALGLAQPEHAWALFEEALAAAPDDAEAIHWLLRAGCVLERWDALAPPLERYLAVKPEDAAVRFALAGVELRRDNDAAARAHHDRLRATAPGFDGLEDLSRALADRRPEVRRSVDVQPGEPV